MVIHQFNKLIRNKWVWGVFAVVVSAAFCFDDMFTTREREERNIGDAGMLAGEAVNAKLFSELVEDVRGFGHQRDWKRNAGEVNRDAWENYAALVVANKNGIEATDAEVQAMIRNDPSFQQNGGFNFKLYQMLLRENSLTPERFEDYLKRRITLMRIGQAVLSAATWTSPMELEQAIADMNDTFTVRVASFKQTKEEAAKVKITDDMIRAWYDKNRESLLLPERLKIRFVKFNALDSKVLAKMVITEEEMRDRYDVTIDKYTSTDTNGVETVKKFEDVKPEIEKELRQIAAVQFFETNINYRVYAKRAAKGASRLDEIAKEEKLRVDKSQWFTLDGDYQEGFMRRINQILPGANGFAEAVAELDSSSEDLRYGVVSSDSAVWLIEKADVSAKHIPDFEEAKAAIRPRVLKEAKFDAFKDSVEAIAARGAKAVAGVKNISTNITFTVSDLRQGNAASFENQMAVARAVMKLKKGEVSEFTPIGNNAAILVICEDRVEGDAAKAMIIRSQVRDDIVSLQLRQIPESWKKWNLDRLGFEAGEISSVEIVEEAE